MIPLVFWRRELRTNSGGAGIRSPFAIFAQFQRVKYPAQGRNGGRDGAAGRIYLMSGVGLDPNGMQIIPSGETLVLEMPGGGGLGGPVKRARSELVRDLRDGLLTLDVARAEYGFDEV